MLKNVEESNKNWNLDWWAEPHPKVMLCHKWCKPRNRKCMSSQVLNISKDGESTVSLGNLCQCLNTIKVEKFFLCLNADSCVLTCVHCLLSCLSKLLKLTLLSLLPLFQYLYKFIRSLWAFCSPGWIALPSLSASYKRCSRHLVITVACILAHSHGPWPIPLPIVITRHGWTHSMPALSWGAHHWFKHSRCVSPVLNRGNPLFTSLNLLATPFRMQPRRLLSLAIRARCCPVVSLLSTRPFFAELLSSQLAPSLYRRLGLFFTRSRTWHLLCWTPWRSHWPILSACWGPSERQHDCMACQQHLPVLCHMWTCGWYTVSHHKGHWQRS